MMARAPSEPFRTAPLAWSGELFVESVEDALRDAVRAAGGAKRVGAALFPSKPVDAAARYLLDCLNPDRNERLSPDQFVHVLKLARDAGYHGAKHWIDRETGYAPTPPVEPEDRAAELGRVLEQAAATVRDAAAALDRLRGER